MSGAPAPAKWIPSPAVRAYVYKVMVAAGPVVVFYGVLTADEVALWLGFGGTVLAPAGLLALVNTPTPARTDPLRQDGS